MSNEEKKEPSILKKLFDDKVFIFLILICLGLIIAIIIVSFSEAPKYYEPSYSENEDITQNDSTESASEKVYDNPFPVKINTATSEQLQKIPNIGPKTAELIIEYRNIYGTIVEFDDLLSVDGIGKKTVEIIAEYCIID